MGVMVWFVLSKISMDILLGKQELFVIIQLRLNIISLE